MFSSMYFGSRCFGAYLTILCPLESSLEPWTSLARIYPKTDPSEDHGSGVVGSGYTLRVRCYRMWEGYGSWSCFVKLGWEARRPGGGNNSSWVLSLKSGIRVRVSGVSLGSIIYVEHYLQTSLHPSESLGNTLTLILYRVSPLKYHFTLQIGHYSATYILNGEQHLDEMRKKAALYARWWCNTAGSLGVQKCLFLKPFEYLHRMPSMLFCYTWP